jgi:hypothetical protein
MSNRFQGDPLDAVRDLDPLDPQDVPRDTGGGHARALFAEITATDPAAAPPATAPRRRLPRLALAMGALAISVAVVSVATILQSTGTERIVGGIPIASSAMCLESYDLGTLANRDVAFDGTLTGLDDSGEATFDVNRWFTGGTGATAVLDAAAVSGGLTSMGSEGADLEAGGRYLVSGSGGTLWACGFTMTYDTDIAEEWARVFSDR